MTLKEAMDLVVDSKCYDSTFECGYDSTCAKCVEAIEMVEEACKKQIPKRPDRSKNYGFCKCPEGHNIPKVCESGRMRYCPFCGQALDWSDEE